MKKYVVSYQNYAEGDILGEFGLYNEQTLVEARNPESAYRKVKREKKHSADDFMVVEVVWNENILPYGAWQDVNNKYNTFSREEV